MKKLHRLAQTDNEWKALMTISRPKVTYIFRDNFEVDAQQSSQEAMAEISTRLNDSQTSLDNETEYDEEEVIDNINNQLDEIPDPQESE